MSEFQVMLGGFYCVGVALVCVVVWLVTLGRRANTHGHVLEESLQKLIMEHRHVLRQGGFTGLPTVIDTITSAEDSASALVDGAVKGKSKRNGS